MFKGSVLRMLEDLLRGSYLRGTSRNKWPDQRSEEEPRTGGCNICGSNHHSAVHCVFSDVSSLLENAGCEDDNLHVDITDFIYDVEEEDTSDIN